MSTPRRFPIRTSLHYLLLTVVSLIIAFPLLFAISTSFMTPSESLSSPPNLFPSHFNLNSYHDALAVAPLGKFLLNSLIVSLAIVAGQLFTSALSAYAFAFLRFPGRNLLFYLFLTTMMIPWEVTLIPNYFTIKELGWLSTYQGLAAPFLATAFGTFLLRQFYMQIPRDLYEAAMLDGCGHWRFFLTVVVPLSRPALGTLSVYAFIQAWNMYLWPLLITNKTSMRTVQVGISMLQNEEQLAWNLVMAGVVLVLLPTVIMLIVGQKQLVKGLLSGAVKG
ncbi:carbohydrate ABC transporter permease [Tumebacillus permanentifrigoris]|uniref:Carbohydrate ABC transporter membrane protein 2 (CUT1 family) n=1 Tax=Tumebacillus permanentifrigoris TaxID=378543 RepID=A0A316D3J0_9BACL|nr:carbohydrate ABC transporter permease [Tumebacillus permanentifrigoris]PWK05993.1 carbohydrate ABC transporter membrane protein 2 (CUT1 family) [Tumebacillus permanentifrigoris]